MTTGYNNGLRVLCCWDMDMDMDISPDGAQMSTCWMLYGLEGCVCYTALKIAYTVKPALKQHNCGAHAALSALSSWVFVRARSGRWEVTNEPSMPPFTSHAIKMFMQHIGHSFSITPKRSDCHLSLIPAAVMAVARSALQFLSQTAVIMATGFVRWA